MRPIKLLINAFGPYVETQALDFRELGNRSFFLIHGPTGAGKTTILDAMCFALYGDTSGAERDGKQMRSDHADSSITTEIVFDFAVGGETYRIKRNPEQERPKKRGEGSTTLRADATLWKRTGIREDAEEGNVLAGGWSKVTEEVEKLLGFKSSQFRQVVMLPQGEFRKLLAADSRERQLILETLFRTELFRRIEESLKESAKGLQKNVENIAEQRKWVLQEAKVETPEDLERQLNIHKDELKIVSDKVTRSRIAVKETQDSFITAQRAYEKLEEKKLASAAMAELELTSQGIEVKRYQLSRARQASGLMDAGSSLKSRRKEAGEAEKVLAERKNELSRAQAAKKEAEEKLATENAKEQEREAAGREVTRLDDLTGKVDSLAKSHQEAIRAQDRVKVAMTRQSQAKKSLTIIQKSIEEKTKAYEEAANQAAKAYALEAAYGQAEQISTKRYTLELARKELVSIEQAFTGTYQMLQQAEKNYAGAKTEFFRLQEAWQRGQAAILAGKLTEGSPCPVCGSLEHPQPATSKTWLPSEADIKAQQQAVVDLETLRDKVRDGLNEKAAIKAAVKSKIQNLEQELGEKASIDLKVLQFGAKKAKEHWKKANQAAEMVSNLAKELSKLKEMEKSAKNQMETSEKALQEASSAFEAAQAIMRERESLIPEALRDPASLQNAQKQARDRRDRLMAAFEQARKNVDEVSQALIKAETGVMAAQDALRAAVKRVNEEGDTFRMRLEAAGFNNLKEYEESRKTPEAIESLEKQIKEFDENFRAARDRLARAAQAAEGLKEPDLEKLNIALIEVEKARDEVLAREVQIQSLIQQEMDWLKKLHELNYCVKGLEARYSVLGHLSEVANGKNKYGLTFQRFVLGALLDDVTMAATERLKLMSRGRYHLQRTLDRVRSNAAGGLELEVFDTYTGVARGVATLSGGETFMASLSLALGLADVVQSYAGGIHLDTIFVDEGFGTLDPESLDFAMRALIDLQKGGRLVGIISHVPELRERIDARLEVKLMERGSFATFILS